MKGPVANITCYEDGRPVPDENSFRGTQAALDLVSDLTAEDTVRFLLSGGRALFEKPLVSGAELQDVANQLLASGADIVEMNTIRLNPCLVEIIVFANKISQKDRNPLRKSIL